MDRLEDTCDFDSTVRITLLISEARTRCLGCSQLSVRDTVPSPPSSHAIPKDSSSPAQCAAQSEWFLFSPAAVLGRCVQVTIRSLLHFESCFAVKLCVFFFYVFCSSVLNSVRTNF